MKNFRILLILSAILSGCTTITQLAEPESSVKINSDPVGAQVIVLRGNGITQSIGTTPLSIGKQNVPDLFDETLIVRIQMEGFQPQQLVIPRSPVANSVVFNAKLTEIFKNERSSMNELATNVATIQNLVQRKNYVEAERVARENTGKFAQVAVAWDLLGNVLYLEKNIPSALEAYKKSLDLNPANEATMRMIRKLSPLTGESTRLPSGGDY